MTDITVRPITAEEMLQFRALRQEMLSLHPDAFGSSPDEAEAIDPAAQIKTLLTPPSLLVGAFDGMTLVGSAAFIVDSAWKQRHRGLVFSVYVRADVRGKGVARRMVERIIRHAEALPDLRLIRLTVAVTNPRARALYDRLGFVTYGVDPMGIWVDDRFVDEELRALRLPL